MKKHLLRLLCAALCLALLCPAALALKGQVADPDALPYVMNDSTPADWARDEVNAAVAAGLVPALTGNPGFQDSITREQFAELAVCLVNALYSAGIDDSDAPAFTDCENSQVRLAAAAGIVDGVGNGRFSPTTTTNREQTATMTYRALLYLDNKMHCGVPDGTGALSSFSDRDQVSAWAEEGLSALVAFGLVNGTTDTTVSPKSACTVEQSILLLYRLYTKFVGE